MTNTISVGFITYAVAGEENPGFIESLTLGLAAAFLRVEFRGKLEDPQIKVIPLPILRQFLEIIGTKK